MSTDLAAARNAITTVSTGHQVNEDSWMTMWCSSNWGDLLQPAPLSIALLGSIMVIAASTDDFSLVNADDPQYQWKYATHPGSFKACLMQMVSDGYTAFGTADNSMTRIQNASSQLPQDITTAISAYLPSQLQSILDLTKICVTASKNCEDGFRDIFNLSTELVVACTNQVGTTEQKLNVNNMQLQITQERQKAEEAMVASLKENTDMMKQSFQNADNNFNDAVKNVSLSQRGLLITTITSIIQIAGTAQSADANALDKFKSINRSTEYKCAASGNQGELDPPADWRSSSNSAKLAVENAKFAVDQTRANLQAARDAYNHATAQLVQQQEEISTLNGKLTSLKLTNAGLQAMLPRPQAGCRRVQ
ncbi:hypothetical protein VNI00_003204 [Paramarasmius palmivorus]|uniref:Uncharacterized protein n=1 Tax=Paramarasmius palmivorus TaxID=297713 RepID=A0AAW0DUM6_9AGAR